MTGGPPITSSDRIIMPRKQRDHKAEWQRRKALARERGFSSVRAQRSSAGKKRDHTAEWQRRKARAKARGFTSVQSERRARKSGASDSLTRLITPEARKRAAIEWSRANAWTSYVRIDDTGDANYIKTYYDAFVGDNEPKLPTGRLRGTRAQWRYWVVVTELMTPEEFAERYGKRYDQ